MWMKLSFVCLFVFTLALLTFPAYLFLERFDTEGKGMDLKRIRLVNWAGV